MLMISLSRSKHLFCTFLVAFRLHTANAACRSNELPDVALGKRRFKFAPCWTKDPLAKIGYGRCCDETLTRASCTSAALLEGNDKIIIATKLTGSIVTSTTVTRLNGLGLGKTTKAKYRSGFCKLLRFDDLDICFQHLFRNFRITMSL